MNKQPEDIGTSFINGNISDTKESIKTISQYKAVLIYIMTYYPSELDSFLKLDIE